MRVGLLAILLLAGCDRGPSLTYTETTRPIYEVVCLDSQMYLRNVTAGLTLEAIESVRPGGDTLWWQCGDGTMAVKIPHVVRLRD